MSVTTQTIYSSIELVLYHCCICGVPYGLSRDLYEAALRDHTICFYCPAGHSQHNVGETEKEALQRQLDAARASIASWRADAASLERQKRAYKGQATKLRKRAQQGICPVCTRGFANYARHMQTEHPDFEPDIP